MKNQFIQKIITNKKLVKTSLALMITSFVVFTISGYLIIRDNEPNDHAGLELSVANARYLNEMDQTDDAIKVLEIMHENDPANVEANELLSEYYFFNEDMEKFEIFATDNNIDTAYSNQGFATISRAKMDDEKSQQYYEKAIQSEPNNGEIYITYASFWQSRANLEKALEVLEGAIANNVKSARIFATLASVSLKMDDKVKAKDYAEKSLDIVANNATALGVINSL